MKNLLRGDMGTSYKNNIPVWNQVIDRLPNTAILAVAGIFIALLFGIPIGILSAKKQYSLLDNISMVAALIGVSMPNFWSGLLLVMLFSLTLGWLPSQGMGSGGVIPVLRSIILPSLTLGINSMAMVARMTRSSMLEVIRQDYISTAQAKGLNDHVITTQHMLRNALIPIITAVGLQFGHLLGGAMLADVSITIGNTTFGQVVYTLRDAFPTSWRLGNLAVINLNEIDRYRTRQIAAGEFPLEEMTIAYGRLDYSKA